MEALDMALDQDELLNVVQSNHQQRTDKVFEINRESNNLTR